MDYSSEFKDLQVLETDSESVEVVRSESRHDCEATAACPEYNVPNYIVNIPEDISLQRLQTIPKKAMMWGYRGFELLKEYFDQITA